MVPWKGKSLLLKTLTIQQTVKLTSNQPTEVSLPSAGWEGRKYLFSSFICPILYRCEESNQARCCQICLDIYTDFPKSACQCWDKGLKSAIQPHQYRRNTHAVACCGLSPNVSVHLNHQDFLNIHTVIKYKQKNRREVITWQWSILSKKSRGSLTP